MAQDALEIRGLSKTFAGQRALADVSMTFPAGSVTALLGQNGSGKSTLIKILAGFYVPDDGGEVRLRGEPLSLPVDTHDVHRLGIRFMHQDLGLVDALSIADNFAFVDRFRTVGVRFAGTLAPISRARESRRVANVLDRFGIHENPHLLVGSLDPTTRTMIAMARAVQDWGEDQGGSRFVLVLDEPTAALPSGEVERVLDFVLAIRRGGGTVVYITHRIDEVLTIADRVVILRDGRVVAERDIRGLDASAVANLIIGHELEVITARERDAEKRGEVVFRAKSLTGPRIVNVDLDLHRGEIVGIAGLLGCGRSELMRFVAGAQRPFSGECEIEGMPYAPRKRGDGLDHGVVYVPQDRRGEGCIPAMSLQDNLTIGTLDEFVSHGWLNLRSERRSTVNAARRFGITPVDPRRLVGHFSGGNQQKAVLAKAVRHNPRVLVLDEPLQGVDVGAKREIADIIRQLADDGVAVLVGSTDIEDLIGLCDRIMVLNRGQVAGVVADDEITNERLMLLSAHFEGEVAA
jgi:ribose transport system ATP-binding protein